MTRDFFDPCHFVFYTTNGILEKKSIYLLLTGYALWAGGGGLGDLEFVEKNIIN